MFCVWQLSSEKKSVFIFDLFCFVFRYDTSTAIFTVPTGGDGLYYFSIYLLVENGEWGEFRLWVNGEILCSAYGDAYNSPSEDPQATCSGLAQLTMG